MIEFRQNAGVIRTNSGNSSRILMLDLIGRANVVCGLVIPTWSQTRFVRQLSVPGKSGGSLLMAGRLLRRS